jgi:SNF2 family DNA or RNA helicase
VARKSKISMVLKPPVEIKVSEEPTEEQRKLYKEIRDEVRHSMRTPTEADIADMKYDAEWRERAIEENKNPKRVITHVWEGDPILDPEHNPDHPIRGRAFYEAQQKNQKENEKRNRLKQLRQKSNEGKVIMNVNETAARSLLTDMGNPRAEKLSSKALESKLNELPTMLDVLEQPKQEENSKLLKQALNAIKEGTTIRVVEEAKPETNGKAHKSTQKAHVAPKSPPKAPKAAKAKKTPTEAKNKPTKAKGEVDRFGSRVGTDLAKVNAVLSKTPKKMAEIVKEAKIKGTCYNHLKKLAEAGFVVATDEGFKVK